MTNHPLDLIAENWKSSEDQYFSHQPISSDFFELDLKGNPKTYNQIKEWISAGVIELKKEMEKRDWSKPFEIILDEEPEINKFNKILSANTNPEKLPDIGYMELYKSSKLTDFITGSFLEQYGLIVSYSAKKILEQHNIGESAFYPITLEHKGKLYENYFFLKTLSSGVDFINYEKSLFYKQEGLLEFETRIDIEINSLQDIENFYQSSKDKDVYLFIKKIVLNNNFPNYDYFMFYKYGVHKRFISPKLATALKNTTGHKIKNTNRIFI